MRFIFPLEPSRAPAHEAAHYLCHVEGLAVALKRGIDHMYRCAQARVMRRRAAAWIEATARSRLYDTRRPVRVD